MPSDNFVATSGTHFTLGNLPFYFSGANNYYLGYKPKSMVDAVLDRAVSLGLKVIRTWGFIDCGSPDGTTPSVDPPFNKQGVYYQFWDSAAAAPAYNDGPDGLERLDYAVHAASQRGLKLIIPLVNNWKEFGGIDQYVAWFHLENHSAFFTHPDALRAYKNWALHLIERYRNESAIMAWELTNEARNPGQDPAVLTGWAAEMSAFIQQNDPNHLVAVGDEGLLNRSGGSDWLYNGGLGADFDALMGIETIDFGTLHSYPENWKKDAAWGGRWIEDHLVASKPVLLEEYGWKDGRTRDAVFRRWLDIVWNRNGAGDLVWMLASEDYPDYDGYTVYRSSDVPVLAEHAARMVSRNV